MANIMEPKLFMVLLGCKPDGRHTEQHDVFFGIGNSLAELKQDMIDFWPEAKAKLHIDAWREVTAVAGHQIKVVAANRQEDGHTVKLFFINLGGYKKGEFDELHYKMLIVADELAGATKAAKNTAFYKHTGFEGAVSHIDDKYGVDVDDVFEIGDVLPLSIKHKFRLQVMPFSDAVEDNMQLGYIPFNKV